MVRVLKVREQRDLARMRFEKPDYLSFDLRRPEETVLVPSNYATREQMDGSIEVVIAEIKAAREDIRILGVKKVLTTDLVHAKIDVAKVIVDAMSVPVKRYFVDREEGLRVAQQREKAGIKETGIKKHLKCAAISLRYSMPVRAQYYSFLKNNRLQNLEDSLDKLRKYSQEALFVSAGGEAHW